jgi:hypothetical protein
VFQAGRLERSGNHFGNTVEAIGGLIIALADVRIK